VKIRVATDFPAGDWVSIRLVPKDQRAKLTPPPSDSEFSGGVGALLIERSEKVIYAGLGERSQLDAAAVRQSSAAASLHLRRISARKVVLFLEEWVEYSGAAVEGLILGNYRFETFRPSKTEPLTEVVLLVPKDDVQSVRKSVALAQPIAESVNEAREIANTPGNLLYPETLAKAARELGARHGLKCRVLEEKHLCSGGFGGILAVGQGSARGPRLIALEHLKGAKNERPLLIVGKAITFDTGGISIKPAAGMEEMVYDKCGGTAVLGAMLAIARLGIRRNVIGILAAAENMPGANAYRPGDIVTMYSKTTVEIVNTDAEGRMVLADALAWGCEKWKPRAIVDLATLTGACGVALGEHAAGLWSNDPTFQSSVQRAASKTGERVWPMPLFREYTTQTESQVAKLKNSGGRLGGANTAAAFLQEFVGQTPWAHLDIAHTSHRSKDQMGLAAGATGFGVRMLVELAQQDELSALD
jgi:leucyl aminopeptidase